MGQHLRTGVRLSSSPPLIKELSQHAAVFFIYTIALLHQLVKNFANIRAYHNLYEQKEYKSSLIMYFFIELYFLSTHVIRAVCYLKI